jgi:hypothetical protein
MVWIDFGFERLNVAIKKAQWLRISPAMTKGHKFLSPKINLQSNGLVFTRSQVQ